MKSDECTENSGDKPITLRHRWVWATSGLMGLGAVLLDVTGVTHQRIIDGVTAATQVSATPPPTPAVANNRPPALKLSFSSNSPKKKARTIEEGETLNLRVVAKDPDHDIVSLDATGLPPGSSWAPSVGNPAVSVLSWTPPPGTAAVLPVDTITLSATDSPTNGTAPITVNQPITLHVGVNTPPTLDTVDPVSAVAGKKLRLTVRAHDSDGDALKFFVSGLPAGAKFKTTDKASGRLTGVLTWKPSAGQANQTFTMTIVAQDNFLNPYQTSEDITITVTP